MTTDTPRTDAARTLGGVIVNDSWALLGEPRSFDSINVVPADFARELERDLHDAEIRIQAEVSRIEMLNCKLTSSRAELERLRRQLKQAVEIAEVFESELDEYHSVDRNCPDAAWHYPDGWERSGEAKDKLEALNKEIK